MIGERIKTPSLTKGISLTELAEKLVLLNLTLVL